jgi:hypothetical protein
MPDADFSKRPLGLEVDRHRDPGQVVAEPVEGDDADRLRAALAAPRDPLARLLLGDLGLPRAADAPDVLMPHQRRVVALLDPLDAVHELRPVLELRELVVGRLEVDADVDELLDRQSAPAAGTAGGLLLLAALADGELVTDGRRELAKCARGPARLADPRCHLLGDEAGTTLDRVLRGFRGRLAHHGLEHLDRGLAERILELAGDRLGALRTAAVSLGAVIVVTRLVAGPLGDAVRLRLRVVRRRLAAPAGLLRNFSHLGPPGVKSCARRRWWGRPAELPVAGRLPSAVRHDAQAKPTAPRRPRKVALSLKAE